jgi:hypothetical protein
VGRAPKGERRYAWAWLSTSSRRHFALIRRSLTKPSALACSYCFIPGYIPATLGVLVAVAGAVLTDRWFGRGSDRESAGVRVLASHPDRCRRCHHPQGVAGRLVGAPSYHVHFWSELPLHVAMRIDASLSDDAAARHRAVFTIGRIVRSERNCQVCAPVLLHL